MSKQNIYLGKAGEEAAVRFLKDSGYKILARNYKTRFGEIDIIAKDKDTLAFVEVKSRHSERFGLPKEAVGRNKQRQISRVAYIYLKENRLFDKRARFDVVSILYSQGQPKLELLKNAFEL